MDRLLNLWLLLAIVAGMLLPLQPAINKQLRDHVGSPYLAALISFTVGTVVLVAITLIVVGKSGIPTMEALRAAPWWSWVGGLIGAIFVTSSIVLVPKLGVVLLVGAVVCGQMLSSVTIDHFGLVGMQVQKLNPGRLFGVLLLIAGLVLIQMSTPRAAEPPSAELLDADGPGEESTTPADTSDGRRASGGPSEPENPGDSARSDAG